MSKRRRYKFKEVLGEVFVDDYSNFDPDIVDTLSNSSEQVTKTGQHGRVKIADSFRTHFDASNSQPSIQYWHLQCSFLCLSLTADSE